MWCYSRCFQTTTHKNSIAIYTNCKGLLALRKATVSQYFGQRGGTTMRRELILKSFQATGVWPTDAEVILNCFNATTFDQDEDIKLRELGNGNSWSNLRKVLDAAVTDKVKSEGKRVAAALHSLQVQNELLHHETRACTLRLLLNRSTRRRVRSLTCSSARGIMAVLCYGVLARSEKRECARW
jgi:hypothetical protein